MRLGGERPERTRRSGFGGDGSCVKGKTRNFNLGWGKVELVTTTQAIKDGVKEAEKVAVNGIEVSRQQPESDFDGVDGHDLPQQSMDLALRAQKGCAVTVTTSATAKAAPRRRLRFIVQDYNPFT